MQLVELSGDILDTIADGVLVVDADGRIADLNDQARRMSGYSRQDLVGRSLELLLPPRLMGSEVDARLLRRDGVELPVDVALSPHGTGVVAVVRDASAKRESERLLREHAQVLELAHDTILVRRLDDGTITFWNQGAAETYGFTRREAVGRVAHDLLRTELPERLATVERRLTERGRWEGELHQIHREGSRVVVSSRWALLRRPHGGADAVLEINRDITSQARAHDRTEAVLEVSQAILAGGEAHAVLELVARHARELTGAALAVVAMPEPGGEFLTVRAASGAEGAAGLVGTRLVRAGWAGARTPPCRAVAIPDLAGDPWVEVTFVRTAGVGPALLAPLTVGDEDRGALMVAKTPSGGGFTDDDMAVVRLLAAAAAAAVEYARSREAEERMVLLGERERLARQLSDGAVQALFAVGMSLQSTALLSSETAVSSRLEASASTLRRVIADLEGCAVELRPRVVRHRRIADALRLLLEEFERESGIASTLDLDALAAVAVEDRSAEILRLTAEALAGVRWHAGATACEVSLRQTDAGTVLGIADDGSAPEPAGRDRPGLRDRVAALDGELAVEAQPGAGTALRVTIPARASGARGHASRR
jgi:PAS domain S-box-containing protein